MIELRWLKGSWGFGKYKLQIRYKKHITNANTGQFILLDAWTDWQDVPEVEEKPMEKNLEHEFILLQNKWRNTNGYLYEDMIKDMVKVAEEHFKGKHHE